MGSFSDYLENELLDHVFGNAAFSAPANVFVALSRADPGETGSSIDEPSGGSYARVTVANNATNWPAAAGGAKSNGTAIQFATATASWGNCGWFAIFDTLTGGNMLGHAALTVPKTIDSGDTASFAIGDLDITLT